ncbi:unnamed protein product [Heterobilharzia americana]|nr:unnamed protein product [Heterobilharzia americana]
MSHVAEKSNKSSAQGQCYHLENNPNDGGQALDLEETAAELRRENFRLRLMLYNYERMYRYANTSQDLESSRVYAAESQNVLLKESLNEKQVLLDSASKMIDILKEENNQLHEQIDDLKRKHHGTENDWRNKYDNLHSELQCTQEKVHALEMCVLAKETEFAKCKNEFQSSIARLQAELAFSQHNSKRYRRELQMFRTEADDLRATLENVNKSHVSVDIKDLESGDLHKSIQTAAELRRENFRLRLMLYNYERMYRYANTSQDLESSRVYAAESQNVLLKESLNEKQVLLDSASKMIDILKEENNQLHEQIDDLKRKHHGTENDWRNKYDNLHSELQCTQEKVHALEMCVLAKETEFAKCKNEFQSSIARLQAELAFSQHNSKRYRRELQMFRTEADDLRATLENVNKSHVSVDIKDLESGDLHKSIQALWDRSPQSNLKIQADAENLSASVSPTFDHGNATCRTPMKECTNLHDHSSKEESYAKLTDRLNSARHLIFALGNENYDQTN